MVGVLEKKYQRLFVQNYNSYCSVSDMGWVSVAVSHLANHFVCIHFRYIGQDVFLQTIIYITFKPIGNKQV